MISWLLFKQIVVLFVMMGMGWLVVKIKFLKPEDSRILSVVCLYLVVPCMQIEAFQIHYSDTILNGFLLALLSACIMHAMLFGITYGGQPSLSLDQCGAWFADLHQRGQFDCAAGDQRLGA